MATQAIEQAPGAEGAAAEPAAPSKRNVLILGAAGLLVGAAVGLFVVGPMLTKKSGGAPPPKPTAEAPSSAVTHPVENLVLNPAGTNGSRFLMVTATFEVKDGGAEQAMKDHDAEVRDRILGLLGQKTIDQLSDYSKREGLKKEVLDAVAPMFPKGSILKVFFAQFVIQ